MRTTQQLAALVLSASLVTPNPVASQVGEPMQVELGGFGSYTYFSSAGTDLDPEFGAGGRLGFHITKNFAIEASGDFTETALSSGATVTVTRVSGSALYHLGASPAFTPYVGFGYDRLFFRRGLESDESAIHGALGARFSLGGRAALRLEGRANFLPSSSLIAGENKALNLGGNVGLSVFAFGGPPRDSDADGVGDNADICAATPSGALVDESGCPTDSDLDRVFDGLDDCPATPAGALVNAVGCPGDDDSDGVFDGIDVCANTPAGAVVDTSGCGRDSDADGVLDGIDQCPATPDGATVDEFGCPSDTDADGVFDGIDRCETTAAGIVVDEFGCPADTDGDGVLNDVDQCAGTPIGTVVDAVGCEDQTDTDGDGVIDSRDRCPNTAPGREVDQIGCPQLFEVQAGEVQPLVLSGVTFGSGSSTLEESSFATLDEVAESLIANPSVRIEIGGHTDATGSRTRNTELSIQRAEAVRQYLMDRGVDPDRLEARGYGPDRPIATNSTRAGRAENRRVELTRIDIDN